MDFVCKLYGNTYAVGLHVTVALVGVATLNLALPAPPVDPFRIRRATSVLLGKGTKFALHHGKCRQPSAAQYKFYTLARLLLNVDITILYPNTQTLRVVLQSGYIFKNYIAALF